MSIKSLDASSAYGNALKRAPELSGTDGGDAIKIGGHGKAPSFGSMIEDMIGSVGQTTKAAEVQSAKAVNRTGDLVDIASAVNNAELTLQTVVAVRDKMIGAYQEIMRMPI